MRTILAAIVVFIPTIAHANEAFPFKDGQRIVFLGDSNTYAGKFIVYLDAYLCTRFPDKRFELINLGLPSETVSGLSEADHPYPRPDVHTRVERALKEAKPDIVVICYGMNDGIYSPFSEDRFKKYQEGITKLITKVEKAGATAILMTPAPFDASALKDKVLGKDAPKFSWVRPYERYDEEVLTKYADWLVTWRAKKYTVIDAHAAVLRHLAALRKEDAAYRVSGDGIHPNANGHMVIALEILKELKAPSTLLDIVIDSSQDPPTKSAIKITSLKGSRVGFTMTLPRPMPADPAWTERAKEIEKFDEAVNRVPLKVAGPKGFLAIRIGNPKEGGRRMSITADKLAAGIDLTEHLKLSQDQKSADAFKLIAEKHRILDLAWLTHVGHKRPDTPKGIPFADAQKKAAALDVEIRMLCTPLETSMGVGPFGK